MNPRGTTDLLGAGIGRTDPDNEIGFYGAYQACFVDDTDLDICDELPGLFELYHSLRRLIEGSGMIIPSWYERIDDLYE